jgi:uncharacterized protein YdhG (YjbR/CyaY superfamily)
VGKEKQAMSESQPEIQNYIDNLPDDRKQAVVMLRKLILDTIPEAQETFRYNMPTFDAAGDFLAALASQKHYLSLYMNTDAVAAHSRELAHLNCGKSCIRFRKLENLPLETVKAILKETYAGNRSRMVGRSRLE